MARRKRGVEAGEVRTRSALKEPYPSNPTRGTKHALYFTNGEKTCVRTYAETYSAARELEIILDGREYKLKEVKLGAVTYPALETEDGLTITTRGPDFDDVLEYTLKGDEKEWMPPEPAPRELERIKNMHLTREREAADPDAPVKTKAKAGGVARVGSSSGFVTITELSEQMKILPRDARHALRKLKWVKPSSGWAWPASEIEGVKTALTGALKKS